MPEPCMISMVTLTTGDPDDPASIAWSSGWLIPSASAEEFAAAMTERHGQPVRSMQPVGALGTDDGLVVLGDAEEAHGG